MSSDSLVSGMWIAGGWHVDRWWVACGSLMGGMWLAGGWHVAAGGRHVAAGGRHVAAGGWHVAAGGWHVAAGGWPVARSWLACGSLYSGHEINVSDISCGIFWIYSLLRIFCGPRILGMWLTAGVWLPVCMCVCVCVCVCVVLGMLLAVGLWLPLYV